MASPSRRCPMAAATRPTHQSPPSSGAPSPKRPTGRSRSRGQPLRPGAEQPVPRAARSPRRLFEHDHALAGRAGILRAAHHVAYRSPAGRAGACVVNPLFGVDKYGEGTARSCAPVRVCCRSSSPSLSSPGRGNRARVGLVDEWDGWRRATALSSIAVNVVDQGNVRSGTRRIARRPSRFRVTLHGRPSAAPRRSDGGSPACTGPVKFWKPGTTPGGITG